MRVLGLIVEYNPFHNGHLYHVQQAQELVQPDCTVAVMSGPFLQRGEPAVMPAWERTETALSCGIDLVVELPAVFAVQNAAIFAEGAVQVLHELGVTDICFGSEHGIVQPFYDACSWLEENEKALEERLTDQLKKGSSFPRSYEKAVASMNPPDGMTDMQQPNNALGLQYVKAARRFGITMHTIPRIEASYHEEHLRTASRIASATAIRRSINEGKDAAEVSPYLPARSWEKLTGFLDSDGLIHTWEAYYPFLQHQLELLEPDGIKEIFGCVEGLESVMYKHRHQANAEQFFRAVKSKRYTRTRLQRLAVAVLLGWKQNAVEACLEYGVDSIRVFGMNKRGRERLRHLQSTLPVYTMAKEQRNGMSALSLKAAAVHKLALPAVSRKSVYEETVRVYD
ncbi:nucleotidyltransferase [Alkalicoccus chagannorensis]|uniref:nucleotidyltransferase n=1 Tax=Alkalicoccus chagannorensis TaxID=427072 RepID=UPI0003FBC41A|nr:nucleotidyltransferase [Alkalicoccus chagannorensis]